MQTDEILIGQLDALLDREREALTQGNVDALSEIAAEKDTLLDALSKADIREADLLSPVNEKVRRNHVLLEQALNGIRAVSGKLSSIRQVRNDFNTYDKTGQKSQVSNQDPTTVEKRA